MVEMVVGAHAEGGPLPRPRRRRIAEGPFGCQTARPASGRRSPDARAMRNAPAGSAGASVHGRVSATPRGSPRRPPRPPPPGTGWRPRRRSRPRRRRRGTGWPRPRRRRVVATGDRRGQGQARRPRRRHRDPPRPRGTGCTRHSPRPSRASPARASRAACRSRALRAATLAGAPDPAGMSLPMMTFSLSPIRWSLAPLMAASVSTRVVSWKDAAARNDDVLSEALVTPSSTVWAVAGSPPSARTRLLCSSNSRRSTSSVGSRSTSPGWSMRTLRSICRTMISMCLSLIVTPWLL